MANTSSALFRNGGSGFTVFQWAGQPIGFAQTINHTSPQPVAAPVAIQPLDQQYPVQIMTPAAIGPGTFQVQLFERYGSKVWDDIMAITDESYKAVGGGKKPGGYTDLSEIFLRLASIGKGVDAYRLIFPPNTGKRADGTQTLTANKRAVDEAVVYGDIYKNCVITDVRDDEKISIDTMEVIKVMTIQYTQAIRAERIS